MDEDQKVTGNVTSIETARNKSKKPKADDKPPKRAEIYLQLCDAINQARHLLPTGFPDFEAVFKLVEQAPGVRMAVTPEPDGSIKATSDEAVVNELLAYCAGPAGARHPCYLMSHREAVEVVKTWKGVTPPLPAVTYLRWLTEAGPCWRRVPFDLKPDPATSQIPTWDHLLSKIEAKPRDALMAWIGSLFVPASYRQQYVWIYGPGGNGKGAITRFLHRVFGPTAHFISHVPREPNQFWTYQLLNRRLIVIPDCANYRFPASGLFKTLSGGDPITIEPKNKAPYTTMLDAKYMFTSNQLPALSSEKADMRRAIFCRMEGNGDWEADFEDRLWTEGGAFLWHCIEAYAKACPLHGPIPVDNSVGDLADWVSTLEEQYEEIFAKHFELTPAEHVTPTDMQRILRGEFPGKFNPGMSEFLHWLDRTHGIRKKTVRLPSGATPKLYPGIKKNNVIMNSYDDRFNRFQD